MKKYIIFLLIAMIFTCSNDTTDSGKSDHPAENVATIGGSQLVFNSDRNGNHEIFMMNIDGSNILQLTDNDLYDCWWPKISPDRTKVLFYRAPKGDHENYEMASLWLYDNVSNSVRLLRDIGENGWTMQGHAEWSPDGKNIAMFGTSGANLEIFVTDNEGKNPVQFTNRGGLNTDVSWSPDGKKIVFNGFPENDYSKENYEIYIMDAEPNATPVRLTFDAYADYDPYISPDGSQIAWLRLYDPLVGEISDGVFLGDWAICISSIDGTNQTYLIQDGNINSKPAWSVDGKTIFFHRMEYNPLVEYRFGIFSILLETKELKRITPVNTGSNEYPVN